LLLSPPLSWLAPPVYRLIARHRDKLPGGTAACALPQAGRDQAGRDQAGRDQAGRDQAGRERVPGQSSS
jgi:hypothetical protein